jgi:HD-like signal output (HDOD) protein
MRISDAARKLITTSAGLATLPSAYMRLSKMLDDPTATADKLANVIRSDPALTARVLKVANSATLGHTRNIETISQAVVVIGTTRLRHVALAASVFGVFRGIPAQLLDMQSFWKHSIAVGLAAEGIGRRMRVSGTETLFISGLLHDIGLVVTCLKLPTQMSRALASAKASGRDLQLLERDEMGFDHGEVGAALLSNWDLASHAMVAMFHHTPTADAGTPTDVVHVADVVATELRMGSAGEGSPQLLDERAWHRLGMRAHELDNIMRWLEREFAELSSLYGP